MKLPTLRKRPESALPGVIGTARVDTHTKNLLKRLRPGDVAVLDHLDLDRMSAEAMVAARVGAVVNAAPSISGRYPNLGPRVLLDAGIPLVDEVGIEVFARVTDGAQIRLDSDTIYRDEQLIGSGRLQTDESIAAATEAAQAGLTTQLEAFAVNTMEYVRADRDLLLDGRGMPPIRTSMQSRHVLIVVRGYDYREDLAALRPYIREYRPVLIGVDAGADALLEAKLEPHLIIGDLDVVSDTALRCGAELIVHADRSGRAPGRARLERIGVEATVFAASATSEDLAMLVADANGADLIVAVGSHGSLVEFLDKGRSGMASTFLTRLTVGGKLVDAKGVNRLYRARIATWQLLLLLSAGLLAVIVALAATPTGQAWLDVAGIRFDDFLYWARGWLSR